MKFWQRIRGLGGDLQLLHPGNACYDRGAKILMAQQLSSHIFLIRASLDFAFACLAGHQNGGGLWILATLQMDTSSPSVKYARIST
jgi:hypothetical protein